MKEFKFNLSPRFLHLVYPVIRSKEKSCRKVLANTGSKLAQSGVFLARFGYSWAHFGALRAHIDTPKPRF